MTGEHKTVDTSDNTDNTSENNDKDYEVSKTGDERAESPDSVKMTSSSETEADSAMSHVTQNILSKLSKSQPPGLQDLLQSNYNFHFVMALYL